jgi:SecD/SecF fusion protein
MTKKVLAVAMTLVIAFIWVITLTGWPFGEKASIKEQMKLGLDISGGVTVVMEAKDTAGKEPAELKKLMEQTLNVIERRVNPDGVGETELRIEGDNRIRVQLPGYKNPDDAIALIGQTAKLQFLLADGTEALTGSDIKNSAVQPDSQRGGYVVTLEFTADGQKKFFEATTKASSGEIAEEDLLKGADGEVAKTEEGYAVQPKAIIIKLDDQIISAPNADNPIDSSDAEITGNFTQKEAAELSMLIRGGALPLDLEVGEVSKVGASSGLGALQNSILAGIIGIILVFILMIGLYRIMGVAASIALVFYIPLLLWSMVLLRGALTLPGMAGIILSIGMAVDANVIIFARIKEEVGEGKTLRVASHTGFRKALTTIIDSQLTTLIASIVLYQFGTGPVKGFALTLMIGIVIGIISALGVAQIYMNAFISSKFLSRPALMGVKEGESDQHVELKHKFKIIKYRKYYYIITVVILIIGIGTGLIRGYNYGIDFTGGTKLQLDMGKQVSIEKVKDLLEKEDVDDAEVVYFGDDNKGVMIKTTKFLTVDEQNKLLDAFSDDFGIDKTAFAESDTNGFEKFGPSIGDVLKKNAVTSILIASLGMLIYIAVRFRWRFGVASVVAIFHDVLILIAFYGLFHVTVNNSFIAAILTVVGYSINDTIVIFDRVRENLVLMRREDLATVLDRSINQTLIRSLTTGTTAVLAVIPLAIIGGETVREFAIPLIIGILAGAASSLFIASPVYYELTKIGKGGRHGKGQSKYLEQTKKAKSKLLTDGSDKDTGEDAKKNNAAKGHSKKSKSKRTSSKTGGAVV